MPRSESSTSDLRAELNRALRSDRKDDALEIYELIELRARDEPRWSHRKGDLLVRMGRTKEAVSAYERAATLYAEQGFATRAIATARLICALDSSRVDVLERCTRQ